MLIKNCLLIISFYFGFNKVSIKFLSILNYLFNFWNTNLKILQAEKIKCKKMVEFHPTPDRPVCTIYDLKNCDRPDIPPSCPILDLTIK